MQAIYVHSQRNKIIYPPDYNLACMCKSGSWLYFFFHCLCDLHTRRHGHTLRHGCIVCWSRHDRVRRRGCTSTYGHTHGKNYSCYSVHCTQMLLKNRGIALLVFFWQLCRFCIFLFSKNLNRARRQSLLIPIRAAILK